MSPGNRHNSPQVQQRTCWSYSYTTTRCRDGVTALLFLLPYNTHTGTATEPKNTGKSGAPQAVLPLSPAPAVLDTRQSHSRGWEWMNSMCWEIPPTTSQAQAFPSVWDEHNDLWEIKDMGKGGRTRNQGEFGMDGDFWFSELQSPTSQALSKAQHSNLASSRGKRGWGCLEPLEQPLMNDFTLPKE